MGACLSFCLGEEKSLNVGNTVKVISGKYKEETGIVFSYGKDTMKIQFGTKINSVKENSLWF